MLCLKRKERERLTITAPTGERIVVTALECGNGWTKVGIDAPLSFKIVRNELIECEPVLAEIGGEG